MSQVLQEQLSLASLFRNLPVKEKQSRLARLTDAELKILTYDWNFWARPNQLAPQGNWRHWLILAGRGWGKTRTGAQWLRQLVEEKQASRIALVGKTSADVRDVMIEGDSGILSISRPEFRPEYIPSKRKLIWPNGCLAFTYSADEPDQLRGPQFDAAWCDELAKWQYRMAWDNLLFGLRLGTNPRSCITTTPVPSAIIKELAKDPQTFVTRGSTYDNKDNLARPFLEAIIKKYEGTRLGRQELFAEILDDNPGALWNTYQLDEARCAKQPELKRIVVAVDPAVSNNESSDETGIIVAGIDENDLGYILEDLSGKYNPNEWGNKAVYAYHKWSADKLVVEVNQGGDLVEANIRTIDRNIPIKKIHANKGKYLRAEPISSLYEQNKVKHVGVFAELESQMCDFTPGSGKSPDRLDAMVYALTELMIKNTEWIFL